MNKVIEKTMFKKMKVAEPNITGQSQMLVDYCLARADKREFLKDMEVLITFLSPHIKNNF